jgi:hypothetical protein
VIEPDVVFWPKRCGALAGGLEGRKRPKPKKIELKQLIILLRP